MLQIDYNTKIDDFESLLLKFWEISGEKIKKIENRYKEENGTPVFTIDGKYVSQGWTEWTQGFQFGSSILQFDATNDKDFLEIGRSNTLKKMSSHISHFGVHDHGFNNLSTYGNLLRLVNEKKIPFNEWEKNFYELAIKISGSVQAQRWTSIPNGGYIYSFNGPHSLFVDTIRSCRILINSHLLGHSLMGENDKQTSLLDRAIQHIITTAEYSVFYGNGKDQYDEWGRTAHESIFNTNDGNFRCYNSQQGYTGYSTWTRGLAWAICGFSEQLELLDILEEKEFENVAPKNEIIEKVKKAAIATSDFYLNNSPVDGVPYWDTGAPKLSLIGDYKNMPADPYNDFEPVDSSAAAIATQGLLRLGKYLKAKGEEKEGERYYKAGLTIAKVLFQSPYLNHQEEHEGLLLHSIYHWPYKWDSVPPGSNIANSNSSMWGDYHLRELALLIQREQTKQEYYSFFSGLL